MKLEEPIYNYFWFWWLVLTGFYIIFFGSFIGGSPGSAPTNFVGLFVPFGLWNTEASFSIKGLITFPLLALSLFYVDRLALKFKLTNSFKRVAFNLLWLLLLTLLVDFILWGKWVSLGWVIGCPNSMCISLEI